MSLATHLTSSVRCFNRSAGRQALLLPTRSLTRLQRGKSVTQAGHLSLSIGSSRHLSLWPWAGSSPKPEATQPPPEQVIAEEVSSTPSSIPAEAVPAEGSANASPDASVLSSSSAPPSGSEATLPTLTDAAALAPTVSAALPVTASPAPDLVSLGLTGLSPAGLCVSALYFAHASLALPWWGSIALVTLSARAALVPLLISAQRTQSRLAPIQPELNSLREEMTQAQREKDMLKMQEAGMKQRRLMKAANVNPVGPMLNGVVQISAQLGMFLGMRRACTAPLESLKEGGFGWIMDLSVADPFFILPVVNTALINVQMFLARRDAAASGNPNTVHILNGMRILSFVSIPFMATFPAGLNLHIGTSLFFVALQTIVLHRPAVRAKLRLPPLPSEGGMPTLRDTYEYARAALRKRYDDAQVQAVMKEEERKRKLRLVSKK